MSGLYSSEYIPNFTHHEISESNIKCDICTTQTWNYMSKNRAIEKLHILVKALNKVNNEPVNSIFGVCNDLKKKLTDYFFAVLDEGNASLGNGTFFTALKENATLMKHFGKMYIYFDEYPPYSGAISKFFVTIINTRIQCDNGYPYSSIKDNTLTWNISFFLLVWPPRFQSLLIMGGVIPSPSIGYDYL